MYSIPEIIATIDGNPWLKVFMVFGWIGGSVQFLEGIRLGWRDKVPGLPLGYLCAIVGHDANVAFRHDLWFDTAHHWYFEYTWYFYPFWVCIEIATIAWFVHLAYKELAPKISALAFYGIYGTFQVTAIALFFFIESLLADPLYIVGLAVSQIVNIVFFIPMLLRRGSTRGQSRLLGWALLLGPGSIGLLQSPAIVPSLRTGWFYAVVACMAALSILYLVLLEYFYRRERSLITAP